jgi:hypothetical protein
MTGIMNNSRNRPRVLRVAPLLQVERPDMNRMQCDARLSDTYNGRADYKFPATLKALLIGKAPGHDGTDWADSDVISQEPGTVTFDRSSGRCRNATPLKFDIVAGIYPQAAICFIDDDDNVVAFGGVRPCGSAQVTGSLVANVDDIEVRLVRPV